MARAAPVLPKPKVEPKAEPERDENVVGMGDIGGMIPAAAAARPLLPDSGRPNNNLHFNYPLFAPGINARLAANALAAPDRDDGVPVIDFAERLKAIRAERDARIKANLKSAAAGSSTGADTAADPERTLRDDDDAGSSEDEEHRTRVEAILAGEGGPIDQG